MAEPGDNSRSRHILDLSRELLDDIELDRLDAEAASQMLSLGEARRVRRNPHMASV